MKKFLKFLALCLLAANLLLLFVFDRMIPVRIPLPFGPGGGAESLSEQVDDGTETEDPQEVEEPSGEPEAKEQPETETEKEPEPQAEAPAEEVYPVCRIISEGGSNIRSGPGTGYEVIDACPYDTILRIRGQAENGWYPVLTEDDREGYIFETQIELPADAEGETGGETGGEAGEQTTGWTQ